MLDIKWIRDNQEAFVKGLTDRGFEPSPEQLIRNILNRDKELRECKRNLQTLQAGANTANTAIGVARSSGGESGLSEQVSSLRLLKTTIQAEEIKQRQLQTDLDTLLAGIPNIPAQDVPEGSDATANEEIRKVGTLPRFLFRPKQHFELGEALGLMDFEMAAKLSGARFVVLKGALARLERALAQFMLDLHTSEHGYTEVNPPLLVREDTMFGTAQLPKFADDQFKAIARVPIESDEFHVELGSPPGTVSVKFLGARQKVLERGFSGQFDLQYPKMTPSGLEGIKPVIYDSYWLIPTAEVSLTNLVREEIVDEAKLPIRVTAWTPCFRAEAGAAGKDTRGMIRQHQFSKVELVSITTPEQSAQEHERMTASAEEVLKRLGIPYRVVVLSTGDMGFAANKTYDIEVWLPGQGEYREISSCSNCGDFQARRMNARYKAKGAKDTRFVHTLNGSGVAVGRALIAVLENYQEEDGSIRIPAALVPYMGGLAKIDAPK